MTKGTCDPSPDAYNETVQAVANGAVELTLRYTWDGTSTIDTGCNGTVTYIRTRNLTSDTYYAHLPRKTRGTNYVTLDPNSDLVVTDRNTIRQLGLDTYQVCQGVRIDRDPTSTGD